MSQRVKRKMEFMVWMAMGIALIIGLFLLFIVFFTSIREVVTTSKQNQGYVRYLACVTEIRNSRNVIAVQRDTSEKCWARAEQEVGMQLTRYSELVGE